MPLLQLDNLTMRFGGLTAISGLGLRVAKGEVVSIIGPNGAGKTTVFNVITGIYAPSEGSIQLDGREEGEPLTWARLLLFVTVALLTGLAGLLVSVNVDSFWRAAINRNTFYATGRPFTWSAAWAGAVGYLRGDLAVEKQRSFARRERGRTPWLVVTADGSRKLGSAHGEEGAQELKAKLQQLIDLAGTNVTLRQRDDTWVILSVDGSQVLARYDSAGEARQQLAELAEVGRAQAAQRWTGRIGFAAGLALGGLSAFVIWWRTRRTPEVLSLAGIARTFQNIRLFPNMTVLENVLVGMDRRFRSGLTGMLYGALGLQGETRAAARDALGLLAFVGLSGKANLLARSLPYGDQRRLEIARALATRPKLLLLDEPAAGMNPSETAGLMALIGQIRDRGVTILLIEHHMNIVMAISDRIVVLDHGVKIAEGTPGEVQKDPAVIAAYLGKEEVA